MISKTGQIQVYFFSGMVPGNWFSMIHTHFLAVQPAVRWTALILWIEGEEEGREEVILAFWAVECCAIVLRAFLQNYWALLSIFEHCWALLSIVEHCWTLLSIVEHCWALLRIAEYFYNCGHVKFVVVQCKFYINFLWKESRW